VDQLATAWRATWPETTVPRASSFPTENYFELNWPRTPTKLKTHTETGFIWNSLYNLRTDHTEDSAYIVETYRMGEARHGIIDEQVSQTTQQNQGLMEIHFVLDRDEALALK
jgi:hypothetical protein